MGILERGKDGKHSKVRTTVVPNRRKSALQAEVRKHVEADSALYTDALQSYIGLDEFQHQVVDHAVAYVDGKVHTNGLENFWSLLKRGISGTYVSVAVSGIVGKRLTFDQLTGKAEADRLLQSRPL